MPSLPSLKDLNLSFKSHPVTGDLLVVKNENAIKQSVRSLLLTNKGERLFNSEIGTRLKELLFEPLDFASSSFIRDEIRDVLDRYEPRVVSRTIEVTPNISEDGYDVRLEYNIRGETKIYNAEYFLNRTSS